MLRSATPAEINAAFESERIRLGRAMTWEEIRALDASLAAVVERETPVTAMTTQNEPALVSRR